MARPPEPEKRRELARRAVPVLQAEGLAVSMSRVAEVLEVKRPTLLYHLPTKGHILEVALEEEEIRCPRVPRNRHRPPTGIRC